MRAMSLAADDAETEQNEMRAMQMQLDQTQKLLLQVTQQLSDVKEQVFSPFVSYSFSFLLTVSHSSSSPAHCFEWDEMMRLSLR